MKCAKMPPGSACERPAQRDELGQILRYQRGDQRIYFYLHYSLTRARVGRAVGINDILAGAPSDLECDVLLTGKQVECWCCWRGMSRQDLVCNILRALYRGSVARPHRW